MEKGTKCPICIEGFMEYREYKQNKYNTGGHAWVCEECPMVMFQYWFDEDIDNLKTIIK